MTQIPSPISIPQQTQRRAGVGQNILLSLAGAAPGLLELFLDRQQQGRDRAQQEQASQTFLAGITDPSSDLLTDQVQQALFAGGATETQANPATGAQLGGAVGQLPQPNLPSTIDPSTIQDPVGTALGIKELFSLEQTAATRRATEAGIDIAQAQESRAVRLFETENETAELTLARNKMLAELDKDPSLGVAALRRGEIELNAANISQINDAMATNLFNREATTVSMVQSMFNQRIARSDDIFRGLLSYGIAPGTARRMANLEVHKEIDAPNFDTVLNDIIADVAERKMMGTESGMLNVFVFLRSGLERGSLRRLRLSNSLSLSLASMIKLSSNLKGSLRLALAQVGRFKKPLNPQSRCSMLAKISPMRRSKPLRDWLLHTLGLDFQRTSVRSPLAHRVRAS